MELSCAVQNYAWGKPGGSSEVALLRSSADPDFAVEEGRPYAELWMGTHPNGPSLLKTGATLQEHISGDKSALGEESRAKFGDDLPFLFKVLSVGKALSIQAHPDIALAKKLHAERPDVYKDPNHKPEMAIALTKFEGLCGFRPLSEIQENIRANEGLRAVIGQDLCDALCASDDSNHAEALRLAFTSLMSTKKEDLQGPLESHKAKVSSKAAKDPLDELFLRLWEQYPGDVGCFVIYLVNHVRLEPGEAMFLGPNLIHAYLSGDCVECMACSDNVVRAGLTPKLIDVPTLCSMLEYRCLQPQEVLFKPEVETAATTVYNPPVPDFAVCKICLDAAESPEMGEGLPLRSVPERSSASIVLIVKGEGRYRAGRSGSTEGMKDGEFRRGTVIFLAAGEQITLKGSEVLAFQAFALDPYGEA